MYKRKILFTLIILICFSGNSQAKNVENSSSYLKSGKDHYQKKEFVSAINDLRKSLRLDPKNKDIILALRDVTRDYGIKLLKENKKEEGKTLLLESGRLSFLIAPRKEIIAEASLVQAGDSFKENDFDKVIEILEKIKDNKNIKDVAYQLLIASYTGKSMKLLETERFNEAKKNIVIAKELLAKSGDKSTEVQKMKAILEKLYNTSSISMGEKYFNEKNFVEAEKEFTKIISEQPDNSLTYSFLAAVKLEQNKLEESVTYLEKAIKLDPAHPYNYYNLACVHSLNNKKELAISNLKQAINIEPQIKNRLVKDKDLNNIKDLNEFKDLLK